MCQQKNHDIAVQTLSWHSGNNDDQTSVIMQQNKISIVTDKIYAI